MSALRIVFVRGDTAKEKLRLALFPLNVDKTMSAPVTAIAAFDTEFYEKMPKLFASPGQSAESLKNHETPYQGFAGKGAFFDGKDGVKFTDITDGLSNTILFAEKYARCNATGSLWGWTTYPSTWLPLFAIAQFGASAVGPASIFQTQPAPYLSNCDPTRTSTSHAAGMQVCLADGSVRSLAPTMSGGTWWAACTPSGGDVLGSDW